MKRLVLAAALVLGLTLPALVSGAVPQPVYFWGSVAAAIGGPGPSSNVEVIRPAAIGLFADGSWDVDHLHWTGWGSSVAHATGISSASNGIPNMAQGKRIKKPAQVTLSNPGRFQGREVYRCFTLTVAAPATSEHLCLTGPHGGYWYLGTPAKGSTAPTTTTTTTNAKAASFYSPSRNLSCEMDDSAGFVRVYCQSLNPPHSVQMGLDGRLTICSGTNAATRCIGNPGEHTPTLGYGKQITVGPFRCRSEPAGVTCIVIKTGKGFRINKAGLRPVGGATAISVGTPTSSEFLSPDRRVFCEMEDPPTNGYYVYCNASGLHAAGIGPDGTAVLCNSGCLGFGAASTSTLASGKQITVGRFRCSSASAGITCIVIKSGKGFLINDNQVVAVGP